MDTKKPLVSIISLCYNQAKFCEATLDSLVAQTYENIEVILLDDYSYDNSVEVIEGWMGKHPDFKIQFIAHEENKGICKSLNEALDIAKGEYIQMIACDDLLAHDKISRQVEIMESLDNSYCLVYSDVRIINDAGEIQPQTFYESKKEYSRPEGWVFTEQVKRNFIKALSSLIRKNAIEKVGKYDERLSFEDVDMFLRLSSKYKFKFDDQIHSLWRKHDQNTTNSLFNNPNHLRSRIMLYSKHLGHTDDTDKIIKNKINTYAFKLYTSEGSIGEDLKSYIKQSSIVLFWVINNSIPPIFYKVFLSLEKSLQRFNSLFKATTQ